MPANIQPEKPCDGQESVWDYPRPPRVESSNKQIKVIFDNIIIANSTHAYRVLETSHPPVYYIPQSDIQMAYLKPVAAYQTVCEFKGKASYWDLEVAGKTINQVAWSYESPNQAFAVIQSYLAFYPGRVDACYVDDERVKAQSGDFYGGWITSTIVGPFKGEAGTRFW